MIKNLTFCIGKYWKGIPSSKQNWGDTAGAVYFYAKKVVKEGERSVILGDWVTVYPDGEMLTNRDRSKGTMMHTLKSVLEITKDQFEVMRKLALLHG